MKTMKVMVLLVVLVGIGAMLTAQTWYNASWQKRVSITINGVSGTLTDFPYLIQVNSSDDLQASSQVNGNDILFTASDGATKLSHEIELYDSPTGTLTAWVKIPTLVNGTVIYMYYGNLSAADQQDIPNVWNSSYKGVWHMRGDGTTTIFESTSNPNAGTKTATANVSTGKIDGAQDFNGTTAFVNCGSDASLDDITVKTIEFWTRMDNLYPVAAQGSHFINKGDTGWFVATDITAPGRCIFGHNFSSGSGTNRWQWPIITTGQWYHFVIVYDRSLATNNPLVWVNGAAQVVTNYNRATGTALSDAAHSFQMSKSPGNARWVDGIMDEVRISSGARSEDWIVTTYNNQNNPTGNVAFGNPVTLAVELSSFTATVTAQYFVRLQWITQSETDALGFAIFRSENNSLEHALQVSPLIDATNSVIQSNYSFEDHEVPPGTWYYWLQSIELNGSFQYHGPVIATVSNGQGGDAPGIPVNSGIMNTFPNPFSPSITIQYGLRETLPVAIRIFNIRGQVIQSYDMPSRSEGMYDLVWDAKDLPAGIYLIQMKAGNTLSTRKVLLSK